MEIQRRQLLRLAAGAVALPAVSRGRVARAPPGGYTIVFGAWTTHVLNGAIYALRYDLVGDFEPIALISTVPFVLYAKKTLPAIDLNELIAWLKANPEKASHGTVSAGSHAVAALFQKETGTRFQFVPYRGAAPAIQDLLAGQIDLMWGFPDYLVQVRAGGIKAYVVTAKARLTTAPDIPTVEEAGLPRLSFSSWFGLFGPKGTPKNVTNKLNEAVVEASVDPAVRSRLVDLGQEVFPRDQQTPEVLAALQKADIEKWWPIIKAANIRGE
jgi:tripartite-type tricarboxylate transporter receptor subunit TctC